MYCISEKQIDFILNDISARGIEMVSLQQDLLDHICCIIEHNLENDGDFENFYLDTISSFYKHDLKEIEEETINLQTFKNYYIMKKIMLVSGTFSAFILTIGILFKFMHWPGAAVMILAGILILSFVFLPLLFILKAKEKKDSKDKIIIALGAIASISMSLGILFKIMHWPFANILCISAIVIMVLLFLPIYFISGIKNPDTKINTIVSSLIIIVGSALILTLVRSPAGTKKENISSTQNFLINEHILENEKLIARKNQIKDAIQTDFEKSSFEIYILADEIKSYLLKKETGESKIESNFENKNVLIGETRVTDLLDSNFEKINILKNKIESYNASLPSSMYKIEINNSIIIKKDKKIDAALNDLIQIQMIALQNQSLYLKN